MNNHEFKLILSLFMFTWYVIYVFSSTQDIFKILVSYLFAIWGMVWFLKYSKKLNSGGKTNENI